VEHERQSGASSVYYHTDDDGTPTAMVVENDEPDGSVNGTVYRYTSNGLRVITYVKSAEGRTTVLDSRTADDLDMTLHSGVIGRSVNRSHTQDTYAGAGSGVNPLTGRSTQQPRRNPDQVNPDRSGVAQPQAGARLRVGDDIVTNPDPHQHGRTGTHDPLGLQRLLREGQGPGGIPEPPAAGPESGAQ